MAEQTRQKSSRQSSTSKRETPTAGTMRGSAQVIEFPNSLAAQKTRSAVAALIFVRTTTTGLLNFSWHHTTRDGRSRGRRMSKFYKGLDTLGVKRGEQKQAVGRSRGGRNT